MLCDIKEIKEARAVRKILISMDGRFLLEFPFELSFQNTSVNCSFLFDSENRKVKPE